MQRGVRAAGDREVVVVAVAAQEPHHLAHRRVDELVGDDEPEVADVEVDGRLGRRGVDDHVRQGDRDRLAGLDLAVGADGDVGGDLDGSALVVEEPEAVARTGRLQRSRFADQLDPAAGQPGREGIHRGGSGGTEGDQVDPLVRGLPQADDVLLGRPLGGEVAHARVGGLLGQSPQAGVEVAFRGQVGHREIDVAQVGDRSFGHHGLLGAVRAGEASGVPRRGASPSAAALPPATAARWSGVRAAASSRSTGSVTPMSNG